MFKQGVQHDFKHNYIRLGTVDVQETIDAIKQHLDNHKNDKKISVEKRVSYKGQLVKLGTLRLKTFAKCGTTCSSCGLEAKYFAFERNSSHESYHLNLWGQLPSGKEVLFTHDHILARGLGGVDSITNTTTMCQICNAEKSQMERVACEKMHDERNRQAVMEN